MFKKQYTQDYYDAVDMLVRDKYYDSYICVLLDVSDTLYSMDEKTAKQLVKDLKIEDFSYDELLNSDYVVIEFDKYAYNSKYSDINNKRFLYIVNDEEGLYVFNITNLNKDNYDFKWEWRDMPKYTEFDSDSIINKYVGYINFNKGTKL